MTEPVLLDEWQEVPELMGAVRRAVDEDPHPGRFLLTGSARARRGSDTWSGIGRVVNLTMYGLTAREEVHRAQGRGFLDKLSSADPAMFPVPEEPPDLRGYIDLALRGGFPEPVLRLEDTARQAWLEAYIDQLVSRDAESIHGTRDPVLLRRYFEALWNEAVKLNGADPDFHRRDLWDAINQGAFPQWELGLQLFDDEFADSLPFDVLDATKIIPEELVPIRRVGRLVLDKVVDNFFAETEQVAFCTQNILPGIDFTNDPLLQGRNFSYLDTQTKRLGGPNFTYLPVNAPKCPFAHFQQDGHMAMQNPVTRSNYEPNSWEGDDGGPREDPSAGFRTFPTDQVGPKRRIRPELFADHYSQARQFYISQTDVERRHIIDAFVFELSKCDRPAIRTRMVAGLRNVHDELAQGVADGLGLAELPDAVRPARPTIEDLPPSPALSILQNGPENLAGREVGVLVTDGADAEVIGSLLEAAEAEQFDVEFVCAAIGGFTTSDGSTRQGDQQIDGGPSVLYDAVLLLPSEQGAPSLAASRRPGTSSPTPMPIASSSGMAPRPGR
jgi:hypothetical protein